MNKITKVLIGAVLIGACVYTYNIVGSKSEKVPSNVEVSQKDFLETLHERVAIIKKHKDKLKDTIVIVEGPDGYKEIVSGEGITEQSQFFIGSISKQFTAVLMLKALSEKNKGNLGEIKTDLHKPLSELLKDTDLLKKLKNVPEQFKNKKQENWLDQVTLHDLLCHTSGLKTFYKSEKNFIKNFGIEQFWDSSVKIDHIELIKSIELKQQNDVKKYEYSNTNYIFVAKIIEQLTNKDFIKYLDEKILTPLKLKNTLLPKNGNFKEVKDNINLPNLILNTYDPLVADVSLHFSAGAMISTIEDLMIWEKALHSGKILNKDLYELMICKHANIDENSNYGYGIFLRSSDNLGKSIAHPGNLFYYQSLEEYFPETQTYVISLSANLIVGEMIKDTLS